MVARLLRPRSAAPGTGTRSMEVTRTSHYGWMALGGVLCLLGLVFVAKAREGNKAMAQSQPPAVVVEKPAPPPDAPRVMPPINTESLTAVPAPAPADIVPAGAT